MLLFDKLDSAQQTFSLALISLWCNRPDVTSGAHHVICFPACSLPLACECPPGQKCWETSTAHRQPVQKFNLGPRFTFCAIRKTLPCHVLPILPSIALYYISLLSGLGNIDIDIDIEDQNRNPNINNRDHLVGRPSLSCPEYLQIRYLSSPR